LTNDEVTFRIADDLFTILISTTSANWA